MYQAKFWKDFNVNEPDEKKKKLRVNKKVEDCKAEWVDSDLKFYSEEEIGKALERAKQEYDWPPSLKEFIALCEYSSEYDNAEKAYQNACQKPIKELDLVTRVTVQEVGQFELKTMKADRMKGEFIRKYRDVILRKRKGEDLEKCFKPDPPPGLPELPATKEFAKGFLDKIKEGLGEHED